jgi:hypothetical protein
LAWSIKSGHGLSDVGQMDGRGVARWHGVVVGTEFWSWIGGYTDDDGHELPRFRPQRSPNPVRPPPMVKVIEQARRLGRCNLRGVITQFRPLSPCRCHSLNTAPQGREQVLVGHSAVEEGKSVSPPHSYSGLNWLSGFATCLMLAYSSRIVVGLLFPLVAF